MDRIRERGDRMGRRALRPTEHGGPAKAAGSSRSGVGGHRTTNTAPIGPRPLLTKEAVPRSRAYLMAAIGLRPADGIRDTPGQRLRFLMRQVRE